MRKLKKNEIELIKKVLSQNPSKLDEFISRSENYLVEEMKNGDMGGLLFMTDKTTERNLGKTIAEVEMIDEDGIPVMVSLNLDSEGEFFELDIWKVDFSPVKNLS